MEKNALKRILNKDIKEISKQNLNSLGIYIQFNEDNFLEAKAMIVGPKDSLYEGGFLFFNINFPKNYPFSPPDVTYVSRNNIRVHPNIYVGHGTGGYGKVCLSILGTWSGPKWTSIMDITTIFITIQSLLDNNPLHHEPGQENNNTHINMNYNEVIRYETINTLLLKNMYDTPDSFEGFKNEMNDEYQKNKDKVFEFLESNKTKKNKTIHIPYYRINTEINYQKIYDTYKKYMEK